MTVAEVKNDLILKVLQTQDKMLLEQLAEYFQNLLDEKDWWDELSEPQKELARRGSEQIAQGKVTPDAVVRAKARSILERANPSA
jgi:hypothetical protein